MYEKQQKESFISKQIRRPMKIKLHILLIFTFVTLTNFTLKKDLNISVRFENIDTKSDSLKLEFKINYPKSKKKINPSNRIDIYKNDSLLLRLVVDSDKIPINLWDFPSIPNGYKIDYPKSTENMPYFSKKDNLKFVFSVGNFYYGSWEYKAFYSNESSRWLFDKSGNQLVKIRATYEPWMFGKDLIKIETNKHFDTEKLSIQILNSENKEKEFEIKNKKNPTNIFALKLSKKEKKDNMLKIIIQFDTDKYYEDYLFVPERSIIGIAGKYSDL